MNTYFLVFVVAQAMLLQSISASCIRSRRIITGPTIVPAPCFPTCGCVPAPCFPTCGCVPDPCFPTCGCVSAPIVPILPSTTIVQTNSVTNSLVDVLSLLPVVSLLSEKLCPNYITPVNPCCGCGCGCGPYIY